MWSGDTKGAWEVEALTLNGSLPPNYQAESLDYIREGRRTKGVSLDQSRGSGVGEERKERQRGEDKKAPILALWVLFYQLIGNHQHLLSIHCLQRVGRRKEEKWTRKKKKRTREEERQQERRKKGRESRINFDDLIYLSH